MLDGIGNSLGGFFGGLADLGGAAVDGLVDLGHSIGDAAGGAWHGLLGDTAPPVVGGGAAVSPASWSGQSLAKSLGPGWGLPSVMSQGTASFPGSGSFGNAAAPQGAGLMDLNFISNKPFTASFKITDPSYGFVNSGYRQDGAGWKLSDVGFKFIDPAPGALDSFRSDVFSEASFARDFLHTADAATTFEFKDKSYPYLGRGETQFGLNQKWFDGDATQALNFSLVASSLDVAANGRVPGLRSEFSFSDPTWWSSSEMGLFGNLGFKTASSANGTTADQISAGLNFYRDLAPYESTFRLLGQGNLSGAGSPNGNLDLEFSAGRVLLDKPFEVTAGGLFGLHTDFNDSGAHTLLRLGPTLGVNTAPDAQLNFGYDFLHDAWMLSASKDF